MSYEETETKELFMQRRTWRKCSTKEWERIMDLVFAWIKVRLFEGLFISALSPSPSIHSLFQSHPTSDIRVTERTVCSCFVIPLTVLRVCLIIKNLDVEDNCHSQEKRKSLLPLNQRELMLKCIKLRKTTFLKSWVERKGYTDKTQEEYVCTFFVSVSVSCSHVFLPFSCNVLFHFLPHLLLLHLMQKRVNGSRDDSFCRLLLLEFLSVS